eukprot:Sspe_Gene.7752::Locus_2627_Transcript_1_1_Confidence_1.000_Length_1702::g.7752::m.7752
MVSETSPEHMLAPQPTVRGGCQVDVMPRLQTSRRPRLEDVKGEDEAKGATRTRRHHTLGIAAGIVGALCCYYLSPVSTIQNSVHMLSYTTGIPRAVLWEHSQTSLGEVQTMLTSLGLEEYFTSLRSHGYTNLHVIAATTSPPGSWIRPFHWKRLHVEAARTAKPIGFAEDKELPVKEEPPPPLPAPQLALCNSWSSTAGIHLFWEELQSKKAPEARKNLTIPRWTIPKCPSIEPRGVLYDRSPTSHIASMVAMDNLWYRNTLSADQVVYLRRLGVLNQLVVDHELRIAFCGVPKAGSVAMKAWMLRAAGKWSARMAADPTTFQGPRIESGLHMTDDKLRMVLNSGGYFKFTFVRDPFMRTLASYHERFADCPERRPPAECTAWVRALRIDQQKRLNSGELSFQQYLQILRSQQSQRQTVTYQTAHWLPASTVCGMGLITYDFIGRIDSKDVDTQVLYDVVGNQGMTHDQRKAFDKAESTKLQTYHYGVTKEGVAQTIKQVAEVYESDMDFLGYRGEELVAGLQSL